MLISKWKARKWQEEMLDTMGELREHSQIVSPTGSGKSALIGFWLDRNKQRTSLILVPWLSLMTQWATELTNWGIDHYVYHGNNKDIPDGCKVVLSTPWTYSKTVLGQKYKPDVMFIDESHVGLSTSYVSIYESNPEAIRIGISATPANLSQQMDKLSNWFGRMIEARSLDTLFEEDVLLKPNLFDDTTFTEKQHKILSKDNGEYTETTLAKVATIDGLDAFDCVKAWQRRVEHHENRRSLIYCSSVKHAERVAKDFLEIGVEAAVVVAETSPEDRKAIFDRFHNGTLEVITNVSVLTTGFDSPRATHCIIARPTRSLPLAIQMYGRVMRTNDVSDYCQIIDLAGTFICCGLPTTSPDWEYYWNHPEDINNPFGQEEWWEEDGTFDKILSDLPLIDLSGSALVGHCGIHGQYAVEVVTIEGKKQPLPCPACSLSYYVKKRGAIMSRLGKRYDEFKASWEQYVEHRKTILPFITQNMLFKLHNYHNAATGVYSHILKTTLNRLISLAELNPSLSIEDGVGKDEVIDVEDIKSRLDALHEDQMEVGACAKAALKLLREIRPRGVKLNQSVFAKSGTKGYARMTHTMRPEFRNELLELKALLELWKSKTGELHE